MTVVLPVLRIFTIAVQAIFTLRSVLVLLVDLCCRILIVLITRMSLVSPVDGILSIAGISVGAGLSGNFLSFLE